MVVDEVGVRHVEHVFRVEAPRLLRHDRLIGDHVLHVVRTKGAAEPEVRHLTASRVSKTIFFVWGGGVRIDGVKVKSLRL